MKEYKNIVWDWNGTLLNDLETGVSTLNHMLRKRGLDPITVEHYKDIFGFPVKNFYVAVGFDFDKESFHEMSVDFVDTYNLYAGGNVLNRHVNRVLSEIKKSNRKQYVLSALRENILQKMLEDFGISWNFEQVCGSDNIYADGKIERGKGMIEKYGIIPADTLMIGDTLHDAEVAEAMGFDSILYSGGHNSRKRLETKAPVIDDLSELLEYV